MLMGQVLLICEIFMTIPADKQERQYEERTAGTVVRRKNDPLKREKGPMIPGTEKEHEPTAVKER